MIDFILQVTGIGLRTVFALVADARYTDAQFCEKSLRALLDVLQGHAPEDLAHEPGEVHFIYKLLFILQCMYFYVCNYVWSGGILRLNCEAYLKSVLSWKFVYKFSLDGNAWLVVSF